MEKNKSKKYGICRYGNKKYEVHNLETGDIDDGLMVMGIFDTYEDALNAIEQLEKLEGK